MILQYLKQYKVSCKVEKEDSIERYCHGQPAIKKRLDLMGIGPICLHILAKSIMRLVGKFELLSMLDESRCNKWSRGML